MLRTGMNGGGRWLHSGPENQDHPENISQGGVACWSANAHPICLMLRIEMKRGWADRKARPETRITQRTLRRVAIACQSAKARPRQIETTRKSEQECGTQTMQCLPESGIIITLVILSGLDAMSGYTKRKSYAQPVFSAKARFGK